LLSRSLDYTVRHWDVTIGKEIKQFPSDEGGYSNLPYFKIFHVLDNDTLLRTTAAGVGILDLKSGKEAPVANLPSGTPTAVSPDGKFLVFGREQGSWSKGTKTVAFTLWDRIKAKKIRDLSPTFKDPPGASDLGPSPTAAAFSPDGKMIATSWTYYERGPVDFFRAPVGYGVSLWDVATGKETPIKATSALHLAFIDDGKSLKSSGAAFALSPDRKLYARGEGFDVCIRRIGTDELVKQYAGHRDSIDSVAISPDGKLLASGSRDTTVLVWELPEAR
jgi:WD40 repeat protein